MADFASEVELVQLAARNVEQLQDVIRVVEKKLASEQDGAQVLARPCAVLDLKLLEAQAWVEQLIQMVYGAATVSADARKATREPAGPSHTGRASR